MALFKSRRAAILISISVIALLLAACGDDGEDVAAESDPADEAPEVEAPEVEEVEDEEEPEEPAEPVSWTHGVVTLQADAGFTMMARTQGYFEEHGLDVEVLEFEGDGIALQALIAGELDSAELSPGGMFNAVQAGADLEIIGSTICGLAYALYSSMEIETLADLVGRTVGVSSPGSLPDLFTRAALIESGIDPESVTLVNSGGGPDRYGALLGGVVDATALSSERVPVVEEDGVRALAIAGDVTPNYPRRMIMTNPAEAAERPEETANFIAALTRGLRYAAENRDETLALSAEITGADVDDIELGYIFDEIVEKELVCLDAQPPVEKVEWLQNLMVDLGELDEAIPVDRLINDTYHTRAMEIVAERG